MGTPYQHKGDKMFSNNHKTREIKVLVNEKWGSRSGLQLMEVPGFSGNYHFIPTRDELKQFIERRETVETDRWIDAEDRWEVYVVINIEIVTLYNLCKGDVERMENFLKHHTLQR